MPKIAAVAGIAAAAAATSVVDRLSASAWHS